MAAKFAEPPSLLMAYHRGPRFREDFPATERLIALLSAGHRHNCDFSMSTHSWGARHQGIDEHIVARLRAGEPLQDPKHEALRTFVIAMLEKRRAISDADKEAFFNAGFTTRQALEVLFGLALKTLTNYANALARTPPNPEFGDSLWQRPG
jgi:alkylhydroperoxidase family enzyme